MRDALRSADQTTYAASDSVCVFASLRHVPRERKIVIEG
jgi:hypothetical protein